jgi:hypothetical protein
MEEVFIVEKIVRYQLRNELIMLIIAFNWYAYAYRIAVHKLNSFVNSLA